jgi:colanic acid/amylovoran biosynthesis glycosyltransferase
MGKIAPLLLRIAAHDPTLFGNLLARSHELGLVETGRLAYWLLPFLGREFDIIHCHFGPNGVIGAKLKRLGVPGKLVTTFHGHGIWERAETGAMYAGLFDTAAHLLGNSRHTVEKLREFGAPPERVTLHPPSIDPTRFECRPRERSLSDGPVRLLTVARLADEKGLDHAISAVAAVVENRPDLDIEYRIVGHGPLEDELKQHAAAEQIESVVQFPGSMSTDGVVRELAAADLFVLPSLNEGLGMVLLEAQASCLPIVASSVGGIPFAVNSGESALLFPPGEVQSLADALLSLLENPSRWTEMGRNGRQYVEEKFHIDARNDELVALYESLTA